MESEKLKGSAFGVQCLAALCISFLGSQTGFICAWPSYTLANFTSNATLLDAPMSSMEVSLLGSLPNIGGLAASPFCGYIFNSLGRKYATILFGLPYVLAWLIISSATNVTFILLAMTLAGVGIAGQNLAWLIISLTTNVTLILLAMTLAGVGIAGQNVSLIFISEISHDSIRGGLTAISASGYFLGILISYFLGGYFSYFQVVYAHMSLSVACIVMLMLLNESPVYLVMIGKEKEAAKSIAFYNQVAVSSKQVEVELRKIRLQLDPRLEKMLEDQNEKDVEMTVDLIAKIDLEKVPRSEPSWRILRKSKSSKRALVTVLVLIAATIMMGSVVMQVYAEPLFKEAIPSMSPNLCSIILAVDLLVASVVCVLIIDKFGRKNLLIVTSSAAGVCTFLLGIQLQLHFAPHWFTAFIIYFYSFIFTIGGGVIPFVLAAEVFLPEVRGLCNGMCMGFVWLVNFFTLFVFNPLVELMGLGPVFYCFSAVCFLGAAYTQLKLPETKGLSVEAIQLQFLKR